MAPTDEAGTAPATTPTADHGSTAARASALQVSGWGSTFSIVQPRNPAFWVYAALVVWGAATIWRYVASGNLVYGTPITLAIIGFAGYGLIFWAFTQHIDRYAPLPRRLVVLAVLWGAFGAITMASSANTPILSLWAKAFGPAWASDWGAGLTAPYIEEFAKGLGLLLLIALSGRAVATAFDGFILGACIGLGFQIVEDVSYAIGAAGSGFGADPSGNVAQTVALRMAFGLGAHIAYSAIFCAGLVLFIGRPAQQRRRGVGAGLMLAAMILHGIWDDIGGIVGGTVPLLFVMWIGMTAVTLSVVVAVFTITVRPERHYLREVLDPEITAGTVTVEEVDALAGGRSQRRAYRRAPGARRTRRRILAAARDLANELARSGGVDDARVEFARSEILRLRSAQPATRTHG